VPVAALADRPLAFGLPRDLTIAEKANAVCKFLEQDGPHLLVFDSVAYLESFARFIPADAKVCVLVTRGERTCKGSGRFTWFAYRRQKHWHYARLQ
jgi:hypothetical protein